VTDGNATGHHLRKYAVLFALLLVSLVVETAKIRDAEAYLPDLFRTVLGFAIWLVVFKRSRERIAMAAIVVAVTVLNCARHLYKPPSTCPRPP
jgi:hypothetical protein